MELPGKKIIYQANKWPYTGSHSTAGIKQDFHFPVPAAQLGRMFRTLSDYDKNNIKAAVTVMALQFVAEAVRNTLRYRGDAHGHCYLDTEPRIQISISYITRNLWENEQDRRGIFEMEDLLTEDNIAGLLFSVLVLDEQLDLADAFSDQIVISEFGPPRFKKQKPRGGGGDDDDDEDDMDAIAGRPDKPGEALGSADSKYFIPKTRDHQSTLEPRVRFSKHPANMFRSIRNLEAYIRIMCNTVAGVNRLYEHMDSDNIAINGLPPDSIFLPQNAFSLEHAVQQFQAWGAHAIFCDTASWVNRDRPNTNGDMTFGAPCWRGGVTASGSAFEADYADVMAIYPVDKFTARDLMETCLPHIDFVDRRLIRPRRQGARTIIHEGGEAQLCLQDYLAASGFRTVADQIRADQNANMNLDVFNEYFSLFAPVAAEIDEMITDLNNPSLEYQERLRNLQQQGFAWFERTMDPQNPELPEGYRALLLHIWERPDWTPEHDALWQDCEVAMTPFAQLKVRDMVFDDALVKISDNTLLLKARMMRAIFTTYLPRMGQQPHKEHSQYVGTPGTSKSHTLDAIARQLVPGTYETKSGGSMMGMIGRMKSTRLIEIYHELPNLLAPDGDYRGDADKYLRMKLTQLSEGKTEYSTTREVTRDNGDKTREDVSTTADYTATVIGARNIKRVNTTAGSAVEAMYDRFTIVSQRQILAPGRVSLINRVLNASRGEVNSAFGKLQDHNRFLHRAIMEYGALISCYALPMPNLDVFSALAPLAVSYLAQLRPELHFQLRNISRIKTRMYVEVIQQAIRMALCSPLSPTAERVDLVDGRARLVFAEYNREEAMRETARYAYANMDQVVFVITEAMYELTNAESFAIAREFGEKSANFFSLGRKASDSDATAQRWDTAADPPAHIANIGTHAPNRATLPIFVARYKNEGMYYLGMPNSTQVMRSRAVGGRGGRDSQYAAFELRAVTVDKGYEQLFMLNSHEEAEPRKLKRDTAPTYKREYHKNATYINPNYVTIQSDIHNFARLMAGQIGEYHLNEAAITELLYGLRKKQIVTPYMPVIDTELPMAKCLAEIQSLRYINSVMRTFPKYKVPVLIVNQHENEFYILASYFETNPYDVVQGMVDHISYHATMPRKTIMGIPSQKHCLHYEPFEIRPQQGVALTLPRSSNINTQTLKLVQEFCDTEMPEFVREDEVYREVDIEEKYALDYLRRTNPATDPATLQQYTPRGIWTRLYGPGGYYRQNATGLYTQPYPEVFAPAPPPTPAPNPQPMQAAAAVHPQAATRTSSAIQAAEAAAKRQRVMQTNVLNLGLGGLDLDSM